MYPTLILPTATPFLYAVHGALRSGDYEADYALFQALSTLLFAGGMAVFGAQCGWPWPAWLAATGLMGLGYGPLWHDIQAANTNRIQLGLVAAALALLHGPSRLRGAAGAALFGLALAYKPNVAFAWLLVGLATLARGGPRRLAWTCGATLAGGAAAFAAGSAYFGSRSCWGEWLSQLPTPASMRAIGLMDFSGAGLLGSLLGRDFSVPLGAAGSALFGLLLWRGARRAPSGSRELAAAALGLALPVVCGPLAWNHYAVLALPLFLYALRPDSRAPGWRWAAGLGWLLAAAVPFEPVAAVIGPTAAILALLAGVGLGLAATSADLLRNA